MKRYFNLGTFFNDIVDQHGDKEALATNQKQITYRELNALSNQLAYFLINQGISKKDVVAIFNTKNSSGYALMLACLKIGAVYVNLDSDNPAARLSKIIASCKPKLLISDHSPSETLCNIASQSKLPLKDISDTTEFKNLPTSNGVITDKLVGSHPAYIMFTSGSTGVPKGVLISHENLLNFIGWTIERFGITPEDRFAQLSPLYFDNSVFDFYTALFSGACLVPISKETSKNPKSLVEAVDQQKCTVWFSVPSLLVYLLKMRVLSKSNMTSIGLIIFGGEGFPKGELKKLYELYADRASLVNVYGPTEGTCICSSYNIVDTDFEDMNKLAPLGVINPNFDYLIMNEHSTEVEAGEKGELCLIGPNVGLGYVNDKERTNNSFFQNPKVLSHREIIYKTGDLVYEKNGLLWFSGRVDNQIKHMGYRIELEEIESALNGLGYISQSAVLYIRVNVNYGKIIAFIATHENVDESTIKADLTDIIPEYMIPSVIEIHEELPKNANGKVDKKQLYDDAV